MKFIFSTIWLLAYIPSPSCWAELDHGVSVGISQQTQVVDLNSNTLNLPVCSPKIQYQLISGPWLIIASASKGNKNQASLSLDDTLRYQLDFNQTSESLYFDYSFEQLIISLGYSQSSLQQTFKTNENGARSAGTNRTDYRSFVTGIGYGWHFEQSQLLTSLSLGQQTTDEYYQLQEIINNTQNIQSSHDEISQSGWLGSLNVNYQHYFSVSEHIQWMLGSGIQYSEIIDGEAHIYQSSHTRLAGNRFFASEHESLVDSDSSSTSLMVQSSLIVDNGSIHLSADKLTSESWSDALFEFDITLYF